MDSSFQSFNDETFSDLALKEGRLENLTFYDCRLERCDLSSASLKRSRFVGCTFSHCDLSLANLTDTELSDARFEYTALVGVNFSLLARTSLAALALTFGSCTLTYAVFKGLGLSGFTLTDCTAREAVFNGVNLSRAELCGTDFEGAAFRPCNLTEADLRGARNYNVSVKQNEVKGLKVSFSEALGLLAGLEVMVS